MKNFADFGSVLLRAFQAYSNTNDLVSKKLDILRKTTNTDLDGSYLFVGFTPSCLGAGIPFYISQVGQDVLEFLDSRSVPYTYIDLDDADDKSFDYVVALDEYFTFAESEQQQLDMISDLARVTAQCLVTSLRDYKNLDYRDRDFSTPVTISNQKEKHIFLECHDHSVGQFSWSSSAYELIGTQAHFYGPFARTPMYFKQLAKFNYDAGAQNFKVEKSLMYKGLIRKNFEHVISITY